MTNQPKFNFDHWDRWLNQVVDDGKGLVSYDTIKNYLQHGDELRLPIGFRTVQCLIMSSFDPWLSYEVFSGRDSIWLLKTTCFIEDLLDDAEIDKLKPGDSLVSGFVPKFVYETRPLKKSSIDSLMAIFNQPIVSFETGRIGLDGTTYELALSSGGFQQVRYSWWEEPTEGWKPIWMGFNALLAYFESVLEDRDDTTRYS